MTDLLTILVYTISFLPLDLRATSAPLTKAFEFIVNIRPVPVGLTCSQSVFKSFQEIYIIVFIG